MCRADIEPAAEPALARVLVEMAIALAEQEGWNVADVRIGPVDFGPDHNEQEQEL